VRISIAINSYSKLKANFSNFLIFLSAKHNPLTPESPESPESVLQFPLKRIKKQKEGGSESDFKSQIACMYFRKKSKILNIANIPSNAKIGRNEVRGFLFS